MGNGTNGPSPTPSIGRSPDLEVVTPVPDEEAGVRNFLPHPRLISLERIVHSPLRKVNVSPEVEGHVAHPGVVEELVVIHAHEVDADSG